MPKSLVQVCVVCRMCMYNMSFVLRSNKIAAKKANKSYIVIGCKPYYFGFKKNWKIILNTYTDSSSSRVMLLKVLLK